MPPLPVIADTFRVALHWSGPSPTDAVNVMHFRGSGGSASGLNTALQANMTAAMWTAISQFAAIDRVAILKLDGSAATQDFIWAANAKWTGGTNSESEVAPSVVVKHQTGLRGRDRRGRTYLGIIAEAAVATGVLSSGLVTSMQAAWDLFLQNMGISNFDPVVASYQYSHATTITAYAVESALGTQRRRQGRIRKGLGF